MTSLPQTTWAMKPVDQLINPTILVDTKERPAVFNRWKKYYVETRGHMAWVKNVQSNEAVCHCCIEPAGAIYPIIIDVTLNQDETMVALYCTDCSSTFDREIILIADLSSPEYKSITIDIKAMASAALKGKGSLENTFVKDNSLQFDGNEAIKTELEKGEEKRTPEDLKNISISFDIEKQTSLFVEAVTASGSKILPVSYFSHYLLGATGLALLAAGCAYLWHKKQKNKKENSDLPKEALVATEVI